MKYSMKKEDIKKKKALSEDELLNVSGGSRPLVGGYIGDNGACPGIKEKDECRKHEDGCLWEAGRCYKDR